MKKMFFTAIALVAFTGASMANTKEIKTTVNNVNKTKKLILRTPCDALWIHYYEFALHELGAAAGSQAAWNFADTMAEVNGC